MLGRALVAEGLARGMDVVGLARQQAELCVDISNPLALINATRRVSPDIIINAAATVSLDQCEADVGRAYAVNARPAALLAEESARCGFRLIQVSTDHYYCDDGRTRHTEGSPIRLINEYARTKFAAEGFALTAPSALVIRTNIVGFRWRNNTPAFVEWVIAAIENRRPITLFADYYHSPIYVRDFAVGLFDLIELDATGVVNLAGHEVVSKAEFIEAIACALGIELDWAERGSVNSLNVIRATSLGLDVSLAESLLGRLLPSVEATVRQLILERDSYVH